MGVFGWVAIGVIGYFLYNRASSGQSLFSLSPATGNAAALQAQQQAQLRALATVVNNKQTATTQQIAALNQALQQLAKQQSQSGSKGGGAPSGGGGGPIGTQGGSRPSQTVDPLSQLFLASDLNGPQASAAQNVLQAGGTIQDAANAAGVTTDQIIGALSPDIENIIQATAPSPVSTNAGTDALVSIDPTPLDVGVGQDQSGATFIDSGTTIPDTTASGALVQIDPIPLIDSGAATQGDGSVVGQDPATDPSFYQDNSLLGSSFTPSTTDMSSGSTAVFDPSTSSMDTLDWSGGGGSTGFDSTSLGGGDSLDSSGF